MTYLNETARPARSGTDLIAGLNGVIDEIAVNGADDFPVLLTIQFPVPDVGHEGKHAWLERIAAQWGTVPRPDGMGGQWAEKSFGSVRLVASVACSARGTFDYQARAAAHGLRNSTAANGATA
jgi:hypothetical protein